MNEQLSINLSSDVNYVYGTVNGVEAIFTLTSPGIWSATVSKALDGKYVISITAYNSAGTSTMLETVIYKLDDIIPLKTDWAKEDFYNAEDLNRVEADTQFIAELIKNLLLEDVRLEPIVVNRDYTSIEFADSFNRLEGNISKLKTFDLPNWQPLKTNWKVGEPFSYKDANRYEQNLDILYKLLTRGLKYCGDFSCGEEVI